MIGRISFDETRISRQWGTHGLFPGLSRNYAVGKNGERSRLGCCSVRPRAELRHERTHQIVNGVACAEWPARARPTAPEAGALPDPVALFRLRPLMSSGARLGQAQDLYLFSGSGCRAATTPRVQRRNGSHGPLGLREAFAPLDAALLVAARR